MQHGKLIMYALTKPKPHQQNYPNFDLELVVMVSLLQIWRHQLNRVNCEIFADHTSLKYIYTHKELNMRKRMWLKLIKVYDYTINYHPRKATVVADALRRKDRLNMLTMTKELYKEFEKLEIKVCFVAKKEKKLKYVT